MNFTEKYKMISKPGRTTEAHTKILKVIAEIFSSPRRKSLNQLPKRSAGKVFILDLLRSSLSEEPVLPVYEKPELLKASPKRPRVHEPYSPSNFVSPSYTLQDRHIRSIKFKSPACVKKKSPEKIRKPHCLSPTVPPTFKPQLIAVAKSPRQNLHS